MRLPLIRKIAVPIAIFLVAAALRLPGVEKQGPFLWDDAIHVLEGRWIVSGAKALTESGRRWVEERRTGEDVWRWKDERPRIAQEMKGMPLFFPRPGFSLLVALGLIATGDAPWAAVRVNAIAGALTVALLALAGPWALGSEALAWISALALAVCGYHVAYSRIGFAEAPATFLATAFFLLYIAERRGAWKSGHALWIAGAIWALACLVQDRLISSSFVLVALEWVPGLRPAGIGRRRRLERTSAIIAPIVLATAACEVPYYAAMLGLKHFGETLPFPTHVERLIRHYGQGIGISGWRPENLPTYPYLYAKLAGAPLCAGFLVGCVAAGRRGRRPDAATRITLAWAILPLLPFSLTAAAARYACVTTPAFAITAGAGIVAIARLVPGSRALRVGVAIAIVLAGLGWAIPITRLTSGFPAATRELASVGSGSVGHFSTQPYVSEVYLGAGVALPAPTTFDALEKGYDKGFGFFLADAFESLLEEKDPAGTGEILKTMQRTAMITRFYPHPWGGSLLLPFEYNFSFPATRGFVERHSRDSATIRLYLLADPADLPRRFRRVELKRLGALAVLSAIVILGGALRFHGMDRLHLFLWDDAVVTLEARGLAAAALEARQSLERKREERRTGRDIWKVKTEVAAIQDAADAAGIPLRFGRPFHETALALTLALFRHPAGEWPDWAGSWLSAIAGTLSVYLIYALGTSLYRREVGCLAALFLAVSGYHVMYSREGFTEAILVCFQLLALLAYVRVRRMPAERPYAGILPLGLICGVGVTAHLRFILVPGILTLYEAFHWARCRKHGAGVEARRLALLWAATFFPPFLCEVPYYLLYLAANRLGLRLHVMTYAEQLALVLRSTGLGYAGSLVHFHFENLLTYPYALVQYEGFGKAALVIAGIALGVRERRLGDGLALAFLAGVTLYYSATVPLLRYGALAIPLGSLLAARAVGRAFPPHKEHGERRSYGFWAKVASWVIYLALLEGTFRSLTVVQTDSGYKTAVEAIQHSPHLSTMLPVSQAYVGPAHAKPVPSTEAQLESLEAAGYRYLLVDNLKNYLSYQGQGFPAQESLLRRIEGACKPARIVPNPFGGSLQFGLELNYRPFLETLNVLRHASAMGADSIVIYDLDECIPSLIGLSKAEDTL